MKDLFEILIIASMAVGILGAENIPLFIGCFVLCGALTYIYSRIWIAEEDEK